MANWTKEQVSPPIYEYMREGHGWAAHIEAPGYSDGSPQWRGTIWLTEVADENGNKPRKVLFNVCGPSVEEVQAILDEVIEGRGWK